MNFHSVLWALALTLFLGALGLPIPENPVLMGGGYAIFNRVSPPEASLALWYLAILVGDTMLFAVAYWFFTRPSMSGFLRRYIGASRLESYQKAFASRGAWTLFLARFTFGIRAAAYIAAGAARYPWRRFLAADGLSVAIQVLLFVGIGYFAGEKVEMAQITGKKIVLVLGVLAGVSLALTWLSTVLFRIISSRSH